MARAKTAAHKKPSRRRSSAAGVASPASPGTSSPGGRRSTRAAEAASRSEFLSVFGSNFGNNFAPAFQSNDHIYFCWGSGMILVLSGEAGSRRAPRRHRYRPGTVALQEIRRFQKTWNLLIPAAPFIRTVKEISNFYAPEIGRWTAEALTALQEVSSTMLQRIFWFICLKMQCCVQFMQSVLH
ncbi:histone H3-like centromeric protein CENH3 isoform X1 [Malania oleifera]|uniref:histone H3-like centromeric protein CENH3 isoform X1 n=1 Tax=Malania oleifera TaxID=397392 RepID=UPI0025AE9728|nr:histone H3-like centromeric protein CENH3 isoform X1 [Malania oleifera]